MTGARKIPSHIERELRRHIRPASAKVSQPQQSSLSSSHGATNNQNNKMLYYTLFGCTAFVGITASFPYLGAAWIGPLSERDEVSVMSTEKAASVTLTS
jgi:hypothetical protein